jgi:hypothetical protein
MNLAILNQKIISILLLMTLQSACAMNQNSINTYDPENIKYYKILPEDDAHNKKIINIATTFFKQDKKVTTRKEFYVFDLIIETNIHYSVTFSHKDHPISARRTVATMRPYTVYIDKTTFKVIDASFGR